MYASQLLPFNLHFSHSFLPSGDDFTNEPLVITVPANRRSYTIETFLTLVESKTVKGNLMGYASLLMPHCPIRQFFNIFDDNIDEDEQSFAIVAEIGPDVPENISCFQIAEGPTICHGRRGVTEIMITDNDRELSN